MENIGNELIKVREKYGISRTELARRIGITPQQLQSIEKTNSTKLSTIRKIQEVINSLDQGNSTDSAIQKNSLKSESWYQSNIDLVNQEKKQLMAQIDRLTHLLELAMTGQMGKLLDVTETAGLFHLDFLGVTNPVASQAA